MFLYGNNNTGKTMLIGAAVNDLALKNIPSFYLDETQFFSRIKSTYNKQAVETSTSILNSMKKAKIIFWDDFSTKAFSGHDLNIALEILSFCDSNMINIVFISNVDIEAKLGSNEKFITERIGKRSLARIKRNKIHCIKMENKPFF